MTTASQQATAPEDDPPPPPVVLEPEVAAETARPIPILDDDWSEPRFKPQPKRELRWRLLVFVLAGCIFLPNLGSFGLWDPWETHYGAVTQNMIETQDWTAGTYDGTGIWWGYKQQIGTERRQGKPFLSKPIFIFWSEALSIRAFGRGEFAIRLPMALLAMLAVLMVYITMTRIYTRRIGFLSAAVMATAPQFFMISRQAQTDMPFVGTMILALCFLMLALFGPRRQISNKNFKFWGLATLGFLLLSTIPQYIVIATDLTLEPPANVVQSGSVFWWKLTHHGIYHAIAYSAVLVGVILWLGHQFRKEARAEGFSDAFKDRWMRRFAMVAFYILVAWSTYAKGLPGALLPGAFILIWLILSWNWRFLGRALIGRGLLISAVVVVPWYAAMFARYGEAFWRRFFIHDHFNRLGAGVHQIDSGEFEHFIKWLGVGTFPWAVLIPLVIVWLVRQNPKDKDTGNQAKLFLSVWFVFTFAFFTIMSTKFHHYIFPAVPALAMLTALFIDWLLEHRKAWYPRLAVFVGIILLGAMTWDLYEDEQHIRNLMTYKYDRPYPEDMLPIDPDAKVSKTASYTWGESTFWRHTPPVLRGILSTTALRYHNFIPFVAGLALLSLLLFFFVKTRMAGLVALGLTAATLAVWSLNYYMPKLSPHWSQKYLFDSYYDTCTLVENPKEIEEAYEPLLFQTGHNKRVCREDVISWLITWRGETYYSYNELKPINKEKPQFMPYLEEWNKGRKFYALMERGKKAGFESKLKQYSDKLKRKGLSGWKDIKDWKVEIINDESLYFQMVMATPVRE